MRLRTNGLAALMIETLGSGELPQTREMLAEWMSEADPNVTGSGGPWVFPVASSRGTFHRFMLPPRLLEK